MKQVIYSVCVFGCITLLASCTVGSGGGSVYRYSHGHSPWYGHYQYYRDGGVIVVPDEPELEATPLPSGPEMMPDIGMPEMDMGMDF
jgi:hypothetical protein